ncbi:synaptonemal complex central element protein 3 [Catharus ustulatus]|uniref:synaptonemal complex central element protein 3 n=1 Tax=Catharus ustulatus TaxID=91951 RepID=UPI001409FF9D|nr:synaptonemal complex central element protein 3 [Catharus ustulatus]
MTEPESQEGNCANRREDAEKFKMDMKKCVQEMERLTVRMGLTVYDCVTIQTNPELPKAVQHLENVFLMCKEQIQKGKSC